MFQVVSKTGVTMKTFATEIEAKAHVAHLVALHRRLSGRGTARYFVEQVA